MDNKNTLQDTVLYKFWERKKAVDGAPVQRTQAEWQEQVYTLSKYGRGIEEATTFLYNKDASFQDFLDWLKLTQQPEPSISAGEPILSAADLEFWNENGYIVIKNAVPVEQCLDAQAAIWEYISATPGNPESWYKDYKGRNGMMVSFFHHPALDANRRSARIRQVYEELYNGTDIFLLIDKISFNPPENGNFKFTGSPLHWDVSLHPPIPYALQGLLYVTDTGAADGAFHCVPGFHKKVDAWVSSLPENADPRALALTELQPIPVPGKAGDLVVWQQALPHCATPNKGAMPRMVQYITYKPVKQVHADIWR